VEKFLVFLAQQNHHCRHVDCGEEARPNFVSLRVGIGDYSRDSAIGSLYTLGAEYAESAGNGGGLARIRDCCSGEQLKC